MDEVCASYTSCNARWDICNCNSRQLQRGQGDCYAIDYSDHVRQHYNTANLVNDRIKALTNHCHLRNSIWLPMSHKYW